MKEAVKRLARIFHQDFLDEIYVSSFYLWDEAKSEADFSFSSGYDSYPELKAGLTPKSLYSHAISAQKANILSWYDEIFGLGYRDSNEVRGLDRYLIAKYLRSKSKVKVQWLADQFRVQTRGGMSHMIYWIGKRLETDSKLNQRWKRLL